MNGIMTAAIVDDEEDLCFLLEQILKKQNFKAISLNSLHEAGEKLPGLHPNIIFLDNQLPDGRGIKFLPHLKELLPCARVIVMTAYNSDNDKVEAMKNGADLFIQKPLSRSLIENSLRCLHL